MMNLPNYLLFSSIIGLFAYLYAVNSRSLPKSNLGEKPEINPFQLTFKEGGMSLNYIKSRLKEYRNKG